MDWFLLLLFRSEISSWSADQIGALDKSFKKIFNQIFAYIYSVLGRTTTKIITWLWEGTKIHQACGFAKTDDSAASTAVILKLVVAILEGQCELYAHCTQKTHSRKWFKHEKVQKHLHCMKNYKTTLTCPYTLQEFSAISLKHLALYENLAMYLLRILARNKNCTHFQLSVTKADALQLKIRNLPAF